MTAEGSIDKIKIELDIYYAIRAIRGVHDAKPTITKKNRKRPPSIFQESINSQLRYNDKVSRNHVYIENITDFIDFDNERATVHPEVRIKHSSEINEDAQAE